ncbi:15420_t:CDS:2, partial [Gigaspora margarita]
MNQSNSNYSSTQQPINEFKNNINGRYLLAPEAAWRIFCYHIISINPPGVARNMGLFTVKNESILAIKEAIDNFYTPVQLCFLFVQLILDGALAVDLCQKFNNELSADFKENDFGLAEPQTWTPEVTAEYQHFSNYIKYKQLAKEFHSKISIEQAIFYDKIISYILYKFENKFQSTINFPIFLDGKATIQSAMKIGLPCRTTALAALLHKGGCTAHSLFCIPVEENNLPIANKAVIECVNYLFHQICNKDKPFGGKPFIGVGDFQQVVPVVKNAEKNPNFAKFIDTIGENWQEDEVNLDIFKTIQNIEKAISFLYSVNIFSDLIALQKRAFLSPQNILVNDFNYKILDSLLGNTYTYF